jgi:cobalamin-dependent methionine synthase I
VSNKARGRTIVQATTKQLEVIEGELMRGMETEGETTIVKELQAALFPVCPKGKTKYH